MPPTARKKKLWVHEKNTGLTTGPFMVFLPWADRPVWRDKLEDARIFADNAMKDIEKHIQNGAVDPAVPTIIILGVIESWEPNPTELSRRLREFKSRLQKKHDRDARRAKPAPRQRRVR